MKLYLTHAFSLGMPFPEMRLGRVEVSYVRVTPEYAKEWIHSMLDKPDVDFIPSIRYQDIAREFSRTLGLSSLNTKRAQVSLSKGDYMLAGIKGIEDTTTWNILTVGDTDD